MTHPPGSDSRPAGEPAADRYLTIPNLLCLVRLLGSLVLIPIALQGNNQLFFWTFLFLAATDWVDGKLAILLDQRSLFGARLDSWADAALYAALAFGLLVLYGETLATEMLWIALALGSYLVSTTAGFWKYRRWPSYHTRAAKTSWLLTALAVIALFTDWSTLPVRIAAVAILLTNLEAIAITWISPHWQADVATLYHAWRRSQPK